MIQGFLLLIDRMLLSETHTAVMDMLFLARLFVSQPAEFHDVH